MQEIRVQYLGPQDPLEKGMATHSSILAWRNPMNRGARWATVYGIAKIRKRLVTITFTFFFHLVLGYWYRVGLPRWLSGKESACWHKRCGFYPWVEKIPWRRKWQPNPVFLPGKSHGQRSLAGYSPWDCKESDMTEQTEHAHTDTGHIHLNTVTTLVKPRKTMSKHGYQTFIHEEPGSNLPLRSSPSLLLT